MTLLTEHAQELLERDREVALADALIDRAKEGRGCVLLVRAPAGIGKSTLLARARERGVHAGLHVLSASGGELERDFPYGVARELLEPALRDVTDPQRAELLSGAAELTAALFGSGLEATPHAHALVHGLYWLVANLADRHPLLLCVDDAHWSDQPSLETILYIARRVEDLPVLLLIAARSGEGGPCEPLLERLADLSATRTVELAPLTPDGAAQVVRRAMGDQADEVFAQACHWATSGNPYFLGELLGALDRAGIPPNADGADRVLRAGPQTIARTLLRRLATLSPDAAALSRALAVLGDRVLPHRAAAVAELAMSAASSCADALAVANVLAPGRPIAFAHPIVRTAILDAMKPSERSEFHDRAAHVLDADGAPAIELARHLLACEPAADAWRVERLCTAAGEALARAAPAAAIAYLERALREPPDAGRRPEIELALGRASARVSSETAIDHFRAALDGLREPVARAEVASELAVMLGLAGRAAEGTRIGEAALEALPPEETELACRLEIALLETARLDSSTRPIAARSFARLAERGGDPELGWVIDGHVAIELCFEGNDRSEVVRLAERALAGAADSRWRRDYEGATCVAIVALIAADEYESAAVHARRLRDDARRQGNLHGMALGNYYLADVNLRAGDLGAAEADARQALRVLSGFEYINGYAVGHVVTALLERGAVGEAADRLLTCDLPDQPPYTNAHLGALAARARLRAVRGEWRPALEDWLAIGAKRLADGRINPSLELWRSSAALCHLALGDTAAARALAEEELELARAFGAPRALGTALRVAGLIEGGDAGTALLEESVQVLAASPVRLEHARALVDWGAALRRAGKRGEPARTPLREALDVATRCGAVGLAEQARAELLASGAKPRRTALRGAASLTPSERRVAELATEGLTNREIAQTLFITIKTVEDHLRNTYRKLDVAGKADLAGAMAAEASAAART